MNAPLPETISPRACADGEQRLAQALRDTAYVINQSLNLDEVLQLILGAIQKVVPHDAANIMLVEDGIARITAVHGYEKLGVDKSVLLNQRRAVSAVPNLVRMTQTGESVVIPDTSQSNDWINFSTSGWILSFLSTPIRHKGVTIGFINLNSSIRGHYAEYHAERLRSFADQAAIAIENARLYEKVRAELAFRRKVELELQDAMNELENRVEQRTAQLKNMNEQMKMELELRQKAERALEMERASLAKRVEERTAELSAANAELAKAVRLKDAFLANMSHELRTPLNTILNVAETLEEQVYGPLNERQMRAIHTQQESASHLLSLINDILDLSKIGAGKFDLNMDLVPVAALCSASTKLVEGTARKKNIQISLVVDPEVKHIWGDLRRLKQVLVNLLSNAVKFTPEDGFVGLAVGGDRENKLVRFMVWDTGIGIPKESISNLFKPFTQLDNSLARKYEGTGLGLALAYHIVEMHGGGIQVSSDPDKGSQFTVTLHWDERAHAGPEAQAEDPTRPVDLETYSSMGMKVQRFFSEFGIELVSDFQDDGNFEKIIQMQPNLLVLNIPANSECRALVNKIRSDPRTAAIPILISVNPADPRESWNLPQGVMPFNLSLTRQEFRKVLSSVTNMGTASLIRKVFLINARLSSSHAAQTTILLVDDNEPTVRPLADFLTARGYKVVLTYSGTEAVAQARELRPNIILMDIQMPGMDGFEAIRRIRMDSSMAATPVVALTALAMPGDRQRCLEAVANEYISKPISLRYLADIIETEIQKTAAAQ